MQDKNKSAKPVNKIRYGAVSVSIWRDIYRNARGEEFEVHSVVLDRTYKDRDGDWKHTNSLKETDVPKAIAALEDAFRYLCKKGKEEEDTGAQEGTDTLEVSEESVK